MARSAQNLIFSAETTSDASAGHHKPTDEFWDASRLESCLHLLNYWMVSDEQVESSSSRSNTQHPMFESVQQFVIHMLSATESSLEELRLCLIYINRVRSLPAGKGRVKLTTQSFCCLFTICLLLASKFLQDIKQDLRVWAYASGFSVAELKSAEWRVLISIQYRLTYNFDHPIRMYLLGAHKNQSAESL